MAFFDTKILKLIESTNPLLFKQYGTKREPLLSVVLEQGSDGEKFYERFCLGDDAKRDPLIMVGMVPGEVVPPPALIGPVLMEVGAIVTAYQNQEAAAFAEGAQPAVGAPVALRLGGLFYHHAYMGAHVVKMRIGKFGSACPAIHSLSALSSVLYRTPTPM